MNNRTRVKICGITNIRDALLAVKAGADAIGFVFYSKSPRNTSIFEVAMIVEALPAFVTTTALFVDAHPHFVKEVIRKTKIDLLQFHGQESPNYCEQFSRPYIKAIRMRDNTNLARESQRYKSAESLLVDTFVPGVPGGTGQSFNWSLLERYPVAVRKKLILAGGLNVSNVVDAIRKVNPFAIDVSGGVESSPGKKDRHKIKRFMKATRRAREDVLEGIVHLEFIEAQECFTIKKQELEDQEAAMKFLKQKLHRTKMKELIELQERYEELEKLECQISQAKAKLLYEINEVKNELF